MDKLMEECLLILRTYNLPACSVTEHVGADRARVRFLKEAIPIIRKAVAEEIKEGLENLTSIGDKDLFVEIDKDLWHTFWEKY